MRCAKPASKASFRRRVSGITWRNGGDVGALGTSASTKFELLVAVTCFRAICRTVAFMFLISSLLLIFSGCGGKVSVQGMSDSERALYRSSAAEDTESVKVRSFEF